MVIHLSFKMNANRKKKEEKDKDKGKGKKNKKDKEKEIEKEDEDLDPDDDQNRIAFNPNFGKLKSFFVSAFKKIIKSTNVVYNLEDDLMPFLQKEKRPNFPIDDQFPWIMDSQSKINEIFEENIEEPQQLLNKYKEFEYILNVDRKVIIGQLFDKDNKAHLDQIKETVADYDKAYF